MVEELIFGDGFKQGEQGDGTVFCHHVQCFPAKNLFYHLEVSLFPVTKQGLFQGIFSKIIGCSLVINAADFVFLQVYFCLIL